MTTPSPDLVVVIPVYNERDGIVDTVEEWLQVLDDLEPLRGEILALDDGSIDDTGALLSNLALRSPRLRHISKANEGHGQTILQGYRHALSQAPEWVFQVDSDGQVPATEFDRLWRQRDTSDFVVGWRQHRDDPPVRLLVTRLLRILTRMGWGQVLPDANVPFRLMRAGYLETLIERLPSGVFAPNLYLTLLASLDGVDVRNVPITHRPRIGGSGSLRSWRLWRACLRSSWELLTFRITGPGRSGGRGPGSP